jgi:hypothetical protein
LIFKVVNTCKKEAENEPKRTPNKMVYEQNPEFQRHTHSKTATEKTHNTNPGCFKFRASKNIGNAVIKNRISPF